MRLDLYLVLIVKVDAMSDYNGGWGSAYARINEINRKKIEESEEYQLRQEITRLTRENVELSIENNILVCENGRLKRRLVKMELNK